MSFSVAGKTAIVTGAANGVGLAIGLHLADAGANVVFADMDETSLKAEVPDAVKEEGNTRIFAGDLREKLTIANLLSATLDAFDEVDILVNASRQVITSDPLDIENDALSTMLDQNLMSAYRLTQLVAKRMIKQGKDSERDCIGKIINLSSIAADRTQPDLSAFSVACAAMNQLTRSLAVALAPERIRVNSVAFGSVMSASLQRFMKDNPGYRETIVEQTPLARIAAPSEVAEAVQFLASESSSFVTGETLVVDGGRSLLDPVKVAAH